MSRATAASRALAFACTLFLAFTVSAAENVGHMTGGGTRLDWNTAITGHAEVRLTVVAPDGTSFSATFPAGRPISLRLADLGEHAIDGEFTYEMLVVPQIPPGIAKKLTDARATNDDAAVKKIQRENKLDRPVVQSGSFRVVNGAIVTTDVPEPTNSRPGKASTSEGSSTASGASAAGGSGGVQAMDNVIADDEIVQGSLCVGLDCVVNESFGFDTVRLKENNTRVKFDDTSSSTGFPAFDWQLTANDSASGGANKFSIEDITTATVPFTVKGAAPTNGIFLDSNGKVGFRTSAPGLDLHMQTTDTPAIRFEQTNAGGFTAQTWDIGANEANFFVRDLTGGSRLPFRVRPGAPTSSIDISATGKVGVGTASPSERLHVFENADANTLLTVENPGTGLMSAGVLRAKSDSATVNFQAHGSGRTVSRFGRTLASWNEMLAVSGNGLIFGTLGSTPLVFGTNSTERMQIGGAGGVTITGNLTVTGVKNFAMIDPVEPSRAIYYTALEGPEAGTYFRGSAKTVSGEATIVLPDTFANVTERERLTVQLTPVGGWGQLYVAEKTPGKLVIRIANGGDDLEFDYLVQGVRKGYLDYQAARPGAFPVQ